MKGVNNPFAPVYFGWKSTPSIPLCFDGFLEAQHLLCGAIPSHCAGLAPSGLDHGSELVELGPRSSSRQKGSRAILSSKSDSLADGSTETLIPQQVEISTEQPVDACNRCRIHPRGVFVTPWFQFRWFDIDVGICSVRVFDPELSAQQVVVRLKTASPAS